MSLRIHVSLGCGVLSPSDVQVLYKKFKRGKIIVPVCACREKLGG